MKKKKIKWPHIKRRKPKPDKDIEKLKMMSRNGKRKTVGAKSNRPEAQLNDKKKFFNLHYERPLYRVYNNKCLPQSLKS